VAELSSPLAQVGDVIQHGQPIPANVVRMRDQQHNPNHPEFWHRMPHGRWSWLREGAQPFGVGCSFEHTQKDADWWPMTVVEVDPEPQPADESDLTGLPRTLDEFLNDLMDEAFSDGGRDNGFSPRTRELRDEILSRWPLQPAEPSVPQVFEVPQPPPGVTEPSDDQVELINRLMLNIPESWDGDESGDWIVEQYVREIERRLLAFGGSLEKWLHAYVESPQFVGACDECGETATDPRHNLPPQHAATPQSAVLCLPEVPEGAVALKGNSTGDRYVPHATRGSWVAPNYTGALHVVLAREHPEGVTVEFAPPREPRTWPKLDDAPSDVGAVEVEGFGEWKRLTPTSALFGSTDPERGIDRPLSLAGLRELGDVTEVTA
jgi:hypothetical protein